MKIPSIYAVDDQPQITELYSIILQMAGYQVKTFNDRVAALDELNPPKTNRISSSPIVSAIPSPSISSCIAASIFNPL